LLICFSLFPFVIHYSVFAQSADEYLAKRDVYVKYHNEYLSAKQAYLNQQTLQTKEIFAQKLKQFLLARSEFLSVYFAFLSEKGQGLLTEENLSGLVQWQNWLSADAGKISAQSSLEGLLSAGEELRKVYPQIEKTVYRFLLDLNIAKQNQILNNIFNLGRLIEENLVFYPDKEEPVTPWLAEVMKKMESAKANYQLAISSFEEIRIIRVGDALRNYKKPLSLLKESRKELEDISGFLDEIIKNFEN